MGSKALSKAGFYEERLLILQPVHPRHMAGLVTCRADPILTARTGHVPFFLVFEQCNGNKGRT